MNPQITDSVYLFDKDGNKIGEKPRKDVDKLKDILEAVYVKVKIGDKTLFAKVKQKAGGLQKTNEGKWGVPIATLVRIGESTEEAFQRACLSDIGCVPEIQNVHGRATYKFENGSIRYIYEFEATLPSIPQYEGTEFLLLDDAEIKEMVNKGEVAETYMVLM
jgi:hypothetical protein